MVKKVPKEEKKEKPKVIGSTTEQLAHENKMLRKLERQIKDATRAKEIIGKRGNYNKIIKRGSLGKIKNKMKRNTLVQQSKAERLKQKKIDTLKKKLLREQHGESAVPKGHTKTIENQRVFDETFMTEKDEEVEKDEEIDEFADYFKEKTTPKILMTTNRRPDGKIFPFLKELKSSFPNLYYYERKNFKIKKILEWVKKRDYTDAMIIYEKKGEPHTMILSHLPKGPTAIFRISSVKMGDDIQNYGHSTDHSPELILNNFDTKLGHRIGRMFAALFPQKPEFEGRQVVTMHNQRDYIFFRRHRYEFKENGNRANLQEIGPRFTMKLKSLQHGTFDTKYGEYEFIYNPKMNVNRKKMFL